MGSILLIKKRFIQDTSSLNREGVLTLHMIMMIQNGDWPCVRRLVEHHPRPRRVTQLFQFGHPSLKR